MPYRGEVTTLLMGAGESGEGEVTATIGESGEGEVTATAGEYGEGEVTATAARGRQLPVDAVEESRVLEGLGLESLELESRASRLLESRAGEGVASLVKLGEVGGANYGRSLYLELCRLTAKSVMGVRGLAPGGRLETVSFGGSIAMEALPELGASG